MVRNALREHLGDHRVERGFVLPHGFTLADAGVAIYIRSVLRVHLIDQELSLAVAVVRRRSYAEVPTHAGFRIGVVAAGRDYRIRAPFVYIGLQRLFGLTRGRVFPAVHLFSPGIGVESVGKQRAEIQRWTGVQGLVAAAIHARNAGAAADQHVVEVVGQPVLGERVGDGSAAAARALSTETRGAVRRLHGIEDVS